MTIYDDLSIMGAAVPLVGELVNTMGISATGVVGGLAGIAAQAALNHRDSARKQAANGAVSTGAPILPTDGTSSTKRKVVEIEYNAQSKRTTVRPVTTPNVADRSSNLTTNAPFFDSEHLEAQGEGTMVPLVAKIGKPVRANHLKSFMDQFMSQGSVRTSFAGRVLTRQAARAYHTQIFRHKFSTQDDTTFTPYPSADAFTTRVLTTTTPAPFELAGPTAQGWPASSFLPPSTTSWRDMTSSHCYYSNDNLTDFENLSWNLNRYYKSKPAVVDYTVPATSFREELSDVPYLNTAHARVSVIQAFNERNYGVNIPTVGKFTPSDGQYHAVINSGQIHYNFMNKGLGGCKVEVIVYKVKKTHTMSATAADYTSNPAAPFDHSVNAIADGWVRKLTANAAVQLSLGKTPKTNDVKTNPGFPFLPKLKTTLEAANDVSELSRHTFAMPSGSRRDFTVKLPGLIWNPSSVPKNDGHNPIMNEYTYMVCIASSGVSTTNVLKDSRYAPNPARGFNVGDDYCESNLQFTGTYTEHVGGAIFVPNSKNWLFNAGALMTQDLTGIDNVVADTRTMIRQKDTVRVPGYVAREEQTYIFPGAPPPGVATGSINTTTVNAAHAATNDANDGSSSGVNAPF